jgi:acyl-CoA synthetase (AMP-forming)/AMP-acid ligase II
MARSKEATNSNPSYCGFSFGSIIEPTRGREWQPAELAARAARRARQFSSLGVARGERVLIHYGNTGEFFADLLAIWRLGACAIPVDPRLTEFEIDRLAELARPVLSIWPGSVPANVEARLHAVGSATVDTCMTDSSLSDEPGWFYDDPALILFTSGTTGDPKGVVHTHRSLHAQWRALTTALAGIRFRRTLCLLPTHFGHGLICNCLFPWLAGNTLCVLPPFRPDTVSRLGQLIDEYDISFMSSVPTVWRLALKLARAPTRGSLDRVFCGSAPLSAHLWREVESWTGAPLSNAYGITETASWLAGTATGESTPKDGLVGRPWGGVIRVLGSGDTQRSFEEIERAAPGEEGYVWVRTPALMQGYYQRDDLTRGVVRDGWFSTGDIGIVDEYGELYLRGREREEINKGGMKIHPADVDSVIEQFEGVADVCTFALEDEFLGEDVGIALVLEGDHPGLRYDLYAWSRDRIASHKLPARWYLLEEIPRTSRGKINRQEVARHCGTLEPITFPSAGHRREDR